MNQALQTQKSGEKTSSQQKSTISKNQEEKRKSPSNIQTKLTIGPPNDHYEREADHMANRIMRMPQSFSGMEGLSQTSPSIQRKCKACSSEEEIQRKPLMMKSEGGTPVATPELSTQLNHSKGGGSPLSGGTSEFMGQAFGADFSSVRVHTDQRAVQMNQGLEARAFTHGTDIYFNRGEYRPQAASGKHLLAHELTHVIQQNGGTTSIQRATTRGAGGCGPLRSVDEDNAGARGAGLHAHTQIQSYLLSSGVLSELRIPRATKNNMASTGCQPAGINEGRADLWKPGTRVGIGEIKPIGFANQYAIPEAEHYVRRGRQSMDRLNGTGSCGRHPKDAEDDAFHRRLGALPVRTQFTKLRGILSADTVIGNFDGDRSRTLKAKLVAPGAVGYWCTGGATNTYTCGVSDSATDEYIDSVLLEAQNIVDQFMLISVERPLERMVQQTDLASIFDVAERHFGAQIRGALIGQLGPYAHLVPTSLSMRDIGAYLQDLIGPVMSSMAIIILRRVKNIILSELRVQIRRALKSMLKSVLLGLCVGVPVVSLAKLLDEFKKQLPNLLNQLMPQVIQVVTARIVAEMMRALARMLQQMYNAIKEVVGFLFDLVIRFLAAVAMLILILGGIVLAVLGVIAIFDLIPGDELALGAAAAALFALVPVLANFVATGEIEET